MSGAVQGKQPTFTFEKVEKLFYPEWGFRPNTPCYPMKLNFIFINGGLGDYICWIPAIQWLASQATWIEGGLIMPTYLKELAAYFMKPYPKWSFTDYKNLDELPKAHETPFRGPVELSRESLNATGAHLLTCGWVYFTNKEKAPEGWDYYPHFDQEDLNKIKLPEEVRGLAPKRYAVITTGMTTNSRKVPHGAWNPVIEHVRSKGLTPVFLGKGVVETGNPRNIHTKWDPDVRYDLGVDLRDKTTLMQAAAVMSNAAFVVGHDNGLLHLAGCTDVPIIFGYNLALPEHREPRRRVGKVYNVVLSDKELACYGCQSKNNFMIGYNFRECFYGDLACQKMLFENGAERWTKQIDLAMKENL